jgi:hypothetical protein
MKELLLAAAIALASPFAFASNCPNEMKQIDAALPSAKLDAGKMEEVKKLRAEGEAMHKAGKHAESMSALTKAKGMLGLK